MAELGELGLEDAAIAGAWAVVSGAGERSRLLDADRGSGADRAGPELDAGQMPLADRAQAHDEPELPGAAAGLVGMRHDRRVEQRRALQRVLLSEIRADQALPGGAHPALSAEPVRDEPEVALHGAVQVTIPPAEIGPRAGKRPAHLVLGHRQDAVDDRLGPRVARD